MRGQSGGGEVIVDGGNRSTGTCIPAARLLTEKDAKTKSLKHEREIVVRAMWCAVNHARAWPRIAHDLRA